VADVDPWATLLDSWPPEPAGGKLCGEPSRSTFAVLIVGDRVSIRPLACTEPAGHQGDHGTPVGWPR
jgi:hypothetical protein